MNVEEVKALGAPFRSAEVQVSIRKRVARLTVFTPDHMDPAIDFELDESEDFEIAVATTLEAARDEGLLDSDTRVSLVNLDAIMPN